MVVVDVVHLVASVLDLVVAYWVDVLLVVEDLGWLVELEDYFQGSGMMLGVRWKVR